MAETAIVKEQRVFEGPAPAQDQVWPDQKLTDNQQRVRQAAELIPVGETGATPMNFAQQVDYAKWMAMSGAAVPSHLRNNVGACLAVMEIAQKFGMPGYMVARQTYVVNGIITFMGQIIMAIINKFCPLKERLKFEFQGEGEELRIIVTGHIKGEAAPVEYVSPMVKDIPVKNSPLWTTDPQQQLCYFGARRWQSRYWPEGLFGVYSPEEVAESGIGADNAIDVSPRPGLRDRLLGPRGEGFAGERIADHIDASIAAARDPKHDDRKPEVPPQTPSGAAEGDSSAAVTGAGVTPSPTPAPTESEPASQESEPRQGDEKSGAASDGAASGATTVGDDVATSAHSSTEQVLPTARPDAATNSPPDPLELAKARGHAAFFEGVKLKAVPVEWRDDEHKKLRWAWEDGWRAARDRKEP